MKDNFKYKRIIVLGGGGSGKSTLANRIGLYTGYPTYHLDNLLLDSIWGKKNKEEWEEMSKQFLSKDVGVVDGNYTSILANRIVWADLVIFIDIPTRVQLYRIFKRNLRIRLGLDKRHGIPDGARERLTSKFFWWVYGWNKHSKKKIFSMLNSVGDKKIVIIKEPRKLDIETLFN